MCMPSTVLHRRQVTSSPCNGRWRTMALALQATSNGTIISGLSPTYTEAHSLLVTLTTRLNCLLRLRMWRRWKVVSLIRTAWTSRCQSVSMATTTCWSLLTCIVLRIFNGVLSVVLLSIHITQHKTVRAISISMQVQQPLITRFMSKERLRHLAITSSTRRLKLLFLTLLTFRCRQSQPKCCLIRNRH